MMHSVIKTSGFHGRIKLWSPEDPSNAVETTNLVTYQGADILMGLLAGKADYRIAAIWFEYATGSPSPITPAATDTAATVQALAATATHGAIQGLLVAPPTLTPSDVSKYQGNIGNFYALTAGTAGIAGSAESFVAGVKIIGMGLVALTLNGPMLYARATRSPVFTVGSSGQVAATWSSEAL